MFRRGKASLLGSKDDRIKLVNDRINVTEKHFGSMRQHFVECTRKLAKKRNAYDELAKSVKAYAEDEPINETLSDGMSSLTTAVTAMADLMDTKVHRMEAKVINELSQLEMLCKTSRERLRMAVIARDKEVQKQQQMIDLKSKFTANKSAADSELVKAKLEVSRANNDIDEIISKYEMDKLSDLKRILIDFVLVSLHYHTKSLEALSSNYIDLVNVDELQDLRSLHKLLKTKKKLDKLIKSPAGAGGGGGEAEGDRKPRKKAGQRSQSMEHLDRDDDMLPLKRLSHLTLSNKNLAEIEAAEQDDDDDDDSDSFDDDADDDEAEEDDDDRADDVNGLFGGRGGKRKPERVKANEVDDEEDSADSQPDEDDSGTVSEDESEYVQKGAKPKAKPQSKDPFLAASGLTRVKTVQQKRPQKKTTNAALSAK